ncbi:MAG: helix-turn-helix domain-containing protein [Nitriliruptoraceae bacterium]|nr:helix-turn-helix domain-containing protein [Nitriliruptoraceae bacterium]
MPPRGSNGTPDRTGPDPVAVSTRAELGALLTDLRRRSGLSLRALARLTGSSASTLSGWCRAENLPYPAQDDTFRRMLDAFDVDDPEPIMAALAQLRDTSRTSKQTEPPYRGLERYDVDDAELFFGRDHLIAHALERLHRQLDGDGPNLLLLVGASGSGKSSLVRAGLAPRLLEAGHRVAHLSPGDTPDEELHRAIGTLAPPESTPSAPADVVIVDGLEALFTPTIEQPRRARFLADLELLSAADAAANRAVVATLRLDFLADLVATGAFGAALEDVQVLVGPLTRSEATQAITEPARRRGVAVDEELLTLLLQDFLPTGSLAETPHIGALPLLSHTLLETWNRSHRGRMTVADYHATGGLAGAVEHSAELAYRRVERVDHPSLRQVLLRLVHLASDAVATRRTTSLVELEGLVTEASGPDEPPRDRLRRILAPFVDARLVTIRTETAEISHDALLSAWPRLRGWLETDRDRLRLQRRLAEAARLWADHDRDPSLLPRGVQLEAMREAVEGADGLGATVEERAYLDAALAHRAELEQLEQRRTLRLRRLTVATATFALMASALALVAVSARGDALLARDEAQSRQVALSVERLAETDPSLAAQLAVVAHDIAPTPEARAALLDRAIGPRATRAIGGPGTSVLSVAPAGGLIAVSDAANAEVALYDTTAGLERVATLPLAEQDAESFAVAFSPTGPLLAVGDTSAAVTLWDLTDPTDPQVLVAGRRGPPGPIPGRACAPAGGERAAVGLGDGAFRWELSDPTRPRPLETLPADEITWSVAYHPERDVIAVGDDIGRVQLWSRADAPALDRELETDGRSVLHLEFSPDGGHLSAGTRAGQAYLWSGTGAPGTEGVDPDEIDLTDPTFDSWVNVVAFDRDGAWLAAGSSDGTMRLWDVTTGGSTTSVAHPAAVTGVGFAPDGATLFSTATDGVTRRWSRANVDGAVVAGRVWSLAFDAAGDSLAAFSGPVTERFTIDGGAARRGDASALPTPGDGVDFSGAGARSPDGHVLAHGTFSGEVLLFDATSTGVPQRLGPALGGSDQLVEAVAFHPHGGWLAAGGADTALRLWDTSGSLDAAPTVVLDDPREIVLNLRWSPSGRYLAAPSADNEVYLYDLEQPADPVLRARLGGFDSEAYAAAFSPDETVLATAGSDATVLLWDVTDPDEPVLLTEELTGPTGRIFDLDISADGRLLAGAVADGKTWVWDIAEPTRPERVAVLGQTTSPMYTVAFSPSGTHLAASGADGHVRLWPLDPAQARDDICRATGDRVTETEWSRYLPDRDLEPVCEP